MKQLHHNGVMVPPRYEGRGLAIKVRGEIIELDDVQEERAMAWAKKIGTPYVEDAKFAENFHDDFSEVLGFEVSHGDVDYSNVHRLVIEDRELRANMSREERIAQAAERKAAREASKERYGWTIVDGTRMEIGNYTVEPSSIFMGRGRHPMRGRWKEGPSHQDIELNLSPDASVPLGDWKAIVWEPDSMWIARWRDRLSGKMKYVWPHDSSPLKQEKDVEKYDKALELKENLASIKAHIEENLDHEDLRRRKTATVTFLIDHCKFRVGDERDEDEAETIGASTLKPEHIDFNEGDRVTFDFIGKDSVRHQLCVEMPGQVISNLKEFSADPESPLFEGVDSRRVSEFLDEAMTGLSSKVFRTHYASTAVETKLDELKVGQEQPDYLKKHVATIANLEAAIVCNHKRTIPKTWESSLQRKKDRLEAQRAKAKENERKLRQRIRDAERKHLERLEGYKRKLQEHEKKLEEYKTQLKENEEQKKSTKSLENRIASKQKAMKTQRQRIRKLNADHVKRMEKLRKQMRDRKERDIASTEKLELQIRAQEDTRDYNLGTSLKSYIDPRIYYDWGRRVDYDWKKYYPKTLQSKFSWVENNSRDDSEEE